VAVLLAAYNGMAWLPAQLASILDQEGVNVTVFASVDESFDGTQQWLEGQMQGDARVVLLPPGHFGGAASNFFRLFRDVEFADFDFVSLADQDDVWLPDKLARAVRRLIDTQAAGYSANVTAFWGDGRKHLIDKAQPQRAFDFAFEAAGPGCTYVLRRDLAITLQAFAHAHTLELAQVYLHDWFIYAFARARGGRWVIDPSPCMYYRQHASNQVGVNKGLGALLRRVRMITDGRAFTQAEMIVRLVGADRIPRIADWLHGGRIGLLRLSLQARQCRRRPRDQLFFFFACLAYAMSPSRLVGKSADK
jgi:rhamnosyltransferase